MKRKYIYLLFVIPIFAFCDLNIDKVNRVLSGLKAAKSLTYYNANASLLNKFKARESKLVFTSKKKADILLFPSSSQGSKPMIVDSYDTLKKNKKTIIGAIYTKKGRTQIFFVRERLKAQGMHLVPSMEQYLIDECYLNSLCLLQ